MSEARPTTRATNSSQHPGMVGKRKRCTKAEMEEARTVEQEAKAEKEKIRQGNLKCIAALESEMAEEDAKEKQAESRPCPRPRPLKAAKGYLELPAQLPIDQTDEEALKYDEEALTNNQGEVSERADDETDQEEPKKKKAKVKIPARDAIKAIKEEAANKAREEEEANAVSAPHHFLYKQYM